MASDPSYPLFPIFAFCGFVLAIVPLPWHLEALNSATCYYMIWASLACLNKFVNSLVWANNALDSAPIWCDVSTRIIIGASVGIPAASLCINRRLYLIARMGATTVTKAEKRRAVLVDTLICVLFPVVCMAFAFIVQGHRFNIYEEIGCYPDIYNTIATYFLVNWWPVVLGLISAGYCVLSLRSFYLRRAQFREFLSSSKTSLTFGRYFRLMALATTELLFTIPISSYAIYLNATTQSMEPWVSWSYVHYQFSRVEQVPSVVWRSDRSLVVALELGQWLNPLCALIFFAYFGIAEEARRHYKEAFWFIASRLGFCRRSSTSSGKQLLSMASAPAVKNLTTRSSELPPAYSLYSVPSSVKASLSSDSETRTSEKMTVYEMLQSRNTTDEHYAYSSTSLTPTTSASTHSHHPLSSPWRESESI